MRPRRWQAQPVMQLSTALSASTSVGAPTSVRIQPVFYRSSLDQIGAEPWVHQPTPLFALVQEEGIDFPFFTRAAVDSAYPSEHYRRRDLRAQIHPQVQPNSLAVLVPPDETVLALGGEEYDGPSARDRFKRRKKRQQITGQWPTDFDASRFAFLPATTYADDTCRIYSEIQRHFLENTIDDGLTWSLWSADEVERLYRLRLSRFLLETELIRERRQVTVNAGQAIYSLPEDTISVCRAAIVSGGVETVLTRVDGWMLDNGAVGWESSQATPYGYVEDSSSGTLQVTLAPTPNANGTLNLIIVADPLVVKHCWPVPIPALFSIYVKWGVIADMLSKEGEANDPQRAGYAEARYQEGIELANLYTTAVGR
jgi:hypothetical protein